MTNPLMLSGKKIMLRDWLEEDLEAWKYWHEGKKEWRKTDGPYFPDMSDRELEMTVQTRLAMIHAGMFEDPRPSLVIADHDAGKIMGTVTSYWLGKETNWLAAGLNLYDPAHWGRGYGTEALSLWTSYLFEKHPEIVRLDLRTWSGNTGMIRLAEKLGFQLEARFRKARIVEGKYYDALGFGILREEWRK